MSAHPTSIASTRSCCVALILAATVARRARAAEADAAGARPAEGLRHSRRPKRFTLPNGLPVTMVPFGQVPKVTIRLVVAGRQTSTKPKDKSGSPISPAT